MKCWFQVAPLKKRVGIITDTYGNMVEVQCSESGKIYIVDASKIEIIK
jgi:hypothetical protein